MGIQGNENSFFTCYLKVVLDDSISHYYCSFVCYARYCFTLFDLGQYGSDNGSGVLMKSKINELFENEKLNIPSPLRINNLSTNRLSYVILGDKIFYDYCVHFRVHKLKSSAFFFINYLRCNTL